MKKMIQILYSSKSKTDLNSDQINKILEISRRNNEKNGVTGILLYRNGEFLQLLEGERLNVYYTFKKIMDDRRHSDISIIYESEINQRLFSRWSMAYKTEFDDCAEIENKLVELKQKQSITHSLDLVTFINSFFYRPCA